MPYDLPVRAGMWMTTSRANALTIDVEDWYHPELVAGHRPSDVEPEVQIQESTARLLDLLRGYRTQATFFVIGEIAERQPQLVQNIVGEGHELACHGMSHRPLWDLNPDKLRNDLSRFRLVMEDIVPGAEVIGFRAPTFSLDGRTAWAVDVLVEAGFRYDSSIFPCRTPLYGVPHCPLGPYRVGSADLTKPAEDGELIEFPMSVWAPFGWRIPLSGGIYLRAIPFALVRHGLRKIARERPFAVYVHPWETYPGTPRVDLPLLSRLATYGNIGKTAARVEALLEAFEFAPMSTVLRELGALEG